MPRTLWWENNQLKMIDQRILPLTYDVLSYDDYRDVAAGHHRHGRARRAGDRRGRRFGMALAALQQPCP